MTHVEVEVNPQGRVTIPAEIRRQLGLHPGSRLVIRQEDGRIVLEDPRHMLARLQQTLTGGRAAAGISQQASEELLDDRRVAADTEAGDGKR